jgi:polysaccharide biosynthesis transport protein
LTQKVTGIVGSGALVGPLGPPSNRADARPPGLSSAPDALGLLKALRRRWALAIFGGLFCAGLAGMGAFFFFPATKYKAQSMVYVSSHRPKEIFETRETLTDYKTYQDTQTILITSRRVLGAAIKNPNVARLPSVLKEEDPIGTLAGRIKVEFPRGGEILSITMPGDDPKELAVLVNAVTDAYLKQIVQQEKTDRVARLERLKSLFGRYQKELQEKRRDYRELAESVGPNDVQSSSIKQQLAAEQMGQLKHELLQLQTDIRQSRIRLKVLEGRPPQKITPQVVSGLAMINQMVENDPQVIQLGQKLANASKLLAHSKAVAKKGSDPSVKHWEQEVALAGAALENRRRALGRQFQAGENPAMEVPAPSELDETRQYLEILAGQEKLLKEQISDMDRDTRTLNVKSIDLHWNEDDIALASEVAKTVGTEVQAMIVELEAPSRIRLIEWAEPPTLTDPSRKSKMAGGVALGGFAAFLGLLSLWEFRSRRIDTVEEVVNGLGINLVGSLPALPARRQSAKQLSAQQQLLIESVDAVRTMLLHLSGRDSLQVLMVTSAMKGEGKTSLSCHVATSLARAGRKVLLIDCDLRNPSTHRVLNEVPVPGLCEYLRGEISADEAVRSTEIGMLHFIPAGQCDPLAVDSLPRDQFRHLLATLRARFDFIIVDSSPLLCVPDSLIISQHVDAALFSILREVSRVPYVYAAYERLSTLGVRILGAVVAGVHDATRGYEYQQYAGRSVTALSRSNESQSSTSG